MDRPIEIRVSAISRDRWVAELVESGVSGWTPQHRFQFEPAPSIRGMIVCSGSLLENCAKKPGLPKTPLRFLASRTTHPLRRRQARPVFAVTTDFKTAAADFVAFVATHDYPPALLWTTPQDV
jgi:hypothetical protein